MPFSYSGGHFTYCFFMSIVRKIRIVRKEYTNLIITFRKSFYI